PGAKRISSRMTGFYKRMFPILWFGLLALILVVMASMSRRTPGVPLVALLVPALIMVLGYFLFRKLLSDLMDEVWDNGKELIVVNEGHVEHESLANIVNVSYSGFTNPKRAVVMLRRPGRWGGKIAFIPLRSSIRILSLGDNEMIDELVRRADEARRKS
ncbi:MAG TPA: hypothetical protein VGM47_09225, partial [Gammaproteobacteria bacterium]